MPLSIESGEIRLVNLKTRIPFRYGIATMTHMPQVYLQLRVTADARTNTGMAADLLPPKWFVKKPDQSPADEINEMIESIQAALSHAIRLDGPNPFAVWREIHTRQTNWARQKNVPLLLAHFGTSLVERALLDAFCRNRMAPFHRLLHKNFLGVNLGQIHPELEGTLASEFLRAEPLPTIIARHTVGLDDPLTEKDISKAKRVNDGLPQSLAAAIEAYRLRHFKIKIRGVLADDLNRLTKVAGVIQSTAPPDYAFTLDGNEQFSSAVLFREYWDTLKHTTALADFLDHLMFVEQPIHRDAALIPEVGDVFKAWADRPPMIIDESDAELDSLRTALELGYHGTSHKNCKGVFKGIANRCLLRQRQRADSSRSFVMSGEDLCNLGPVSLLEDLAVMAALGIESVERNGHHYCAGLSMFPAAMQKAALDHHPDVYRASVARWPTLRIDDGRIRLASVNAAPFGVGFPPDFKEFQSPNDWRPVLK